MKFCITVSCVFINTSNLVTTAHMNVVVLIKHQWFPLTILTLQFL